MSLVFAGYVFLNVFVQCHSFKLELLTNETVKAVKAIPSYLYLFLTIYSVVLYLGLLHRIIFQKYLACFWMSRGTIYHGVTSTNQILHPFHFILTNQSRLQTLTLLLTSEANQEQSQHIFSIKKRVQFFSLLFFQWRNTLQF